MVMRELGGPEVLCIEDRPAPAPADDEVVVELRHAALNYHDILLRESGLGTELPLVIGVDGAGVVRGTVEPGPSAASAPRRLPTRRGRYTAADGIGSCRR
ncbi:hypothetical protein CGL27_00645 [Streptomyces sp. 11-1-2]|nr:hypothetical protein CGL27_00645 [Streptomyces sp. 11-1-2]